MAVIFVSFVVSVLVNVLLSRKLVGKTTDMIIESTDKTMQDLENFYDDLHSKQNEGSPRYWYTKGCKDTATGIKDLLAKISN